MTADRIVQKFRLLYDDQPLIVRSPGRINLIGEHTDYNEGFVMPAAIDKEILFAVAPSHDAASHLYAMMYEEQITIDVHHPEKVHHPLWANYLLGVLRKFMDDGFVLKNFNCVFGGNIPQGAGLSSSAALECGFAFALSTLNGLFIPKQKLMFMAQWAEHHYAGVQCGIMDQFASMMGEEDKVMMLDCRSMDYEYLPFSLPDHAIVLCDTHVKHALVNSDYNTRRTECEQGVELLKRYAPGIKSLRDVTESMLEEHKDEFKGKVYNRCLYVVQEIRRVQEARNDLLRNDLKGFGEKMFATHAGLSSLYEVSCPELDFLVEHATSLGTVLGSRMMGGGFGGCTISIVAKNEVEAFIASSTQAYQKAFGIEMTAHVVQIKAGTSVLSR